jgi:preprotein translocase subunit SecA
MFSSMLERVKHDTISILSKIQIRRPEDVQAVEPPPPDQTTLRFQHAAAPSLVAPPPAAEPRPGPGGRGEPVRPPQAAEPITPYVREQPKVGRNDPCPCGSGKKYKQCHGRLS